jgi:hypothetical protein
MWNRELYKLCFCHPLTCTDYLWIVSFKLQIICAGVNFACLLALAISHVHYRDSVLDFLLARILLTEATHCLRLVSICGQWHHMQWAVLNKVAVGPCVDDFHTSSFTHWLSPTAGDIFIFYIYLSLCPTLTKSDIFNEA